MYIKELKLENFRSARNLELELNEKINVFVGINGAGKTTVLDACAILLVEITKIAMHCENYPPEIFRHSDINNEESTTSKLELKLCDIKNESYTINRFITRFGKENEKLSISLFPYVTKLKNEIHNSNEKTNIPIFAYYPVKRAVHDIQLEVQHEHKLTILDAYTNSLNGATVFKKFFEWFRLREDLENENTRRAKAFISDKQLDFVRHALDIFMPQFTDFHIQRNPLRMAAKKDNKTIFINQLSDGEKCLFALIGDLARRLAIANPMRENPLEGEGIVLIDEIDLHLHPTWQQMIIPQLLKTFPHCQFLVSTHSPHVLTHVASENVFLLENTETDLDVIRPREMYGKTSESILKSFMGLETTRPKEVAQELHQIFIDIQEKNLTTAQERINNLMIQIGDDPELVKARALMRRMESIGR